MIRFFVLVLVAISAVAQTKDETKDRTTKEAAKQPELVRKVVDIRHLSGDRADRAMRLVSAYLGDGVGGTVRYDQTLRTAILIGPEKLVTGAEALLAKFDSPGAIRPEHQIQLRVYLVEAIQEPGGGPVPSEIAPAVEQMKKAFAYPGYRLLDTLTVLGKDTMTAAGVLAGEPQSLNTTYLLRVQSSAVHEDGTTVALKNFNLEIRRRDGTNAIIGTDLTINEGQKRSSANSRRAPRTQSS